MMTMMMMVMMMMMMMMTTRRRRRKYDETRKLEKAQKPQSNTESAFEQRKQTA